MKFLDSVSKCNHGSVLDMVSKVGQRSYLDTLSKLPDETLRREGEIKMDMVSKKGGGNE